MKKKSDAVKKTVCGVCLKHGRRGTHGKRCPSMGLSMRRQAYLDKYDESESLHEYKFLFYTGTDIMVRDWWRSHQKRCKTACVGGGRYSFAHTGIGTYGSLSCACGKTLDFSEYDRW